MDEVVYDKDLYDGRTGKERFEGYATSIPLDGEEVDTTPRQPLLSKRSEILCWRTFRSHSTDNVGHFTFNSAQLSSRDVLRQAREETKGPEIDPFAETKNSHLVEKPGSYQARRKRIVSPERDDPFADLDEDTAKAKPKKGRSYADVMQETDLERKEAIVQRKIERQKKEQHEALLAAARKAEEVEQAGAVASKKRRRWDVGDREDSEERSSKVAKTSSSGSAWGEYTCTHTP